MAKVMHVVLLEVTKATFVIPPSLQSMLMKSSQSITHSGYQSICMWCKNGGTFPSSYVLSISLSTTFDNIFSLMVKCMLDFCGLRVEELVGKLVSISCDESNVFQAHQTSVTTQFRDKVAPFITGMHYFAH
jgi:hypothetical protein